MTSQIDMLIDILAQRMKNCSLSDKKLLDVMLFSYSLIQILFQEIHITLGSGLCQIRRLYILLHDGRTKQIK